MVIIDLTELKFRLTSQPTLSLVNLILKYTTLNHSLPNFVNYTVISEEGTCGRRQLVYLPATQT